MRFQKTFIFFMIIFAILFIAGGCQDKDKPDEYGEQAGRKGQSKADAIDTTAPEWEKESNLDSRGTGSDEADSTAPPPGDLRLDPTEIVVFPGDEFQISAMWETGNETVTADPSALRFSVGEAAWIDVDDGRVTIAQHAPIGRTAAITVHDGEQTATIEVTVQYSLKATVMAGSSEIPVVTNPESTAVLVNKYRSLPDGYKADDLVEPAVRFSFDEKHDKRLLRKEAAKALEELFEEAEQDGIMLFAVSGFRAYGTQKAIFERYVEQQGEEHARRFSAYPGTSEHQTGLAMDVSAASVNYRLEQRFGETEEGKWLAEHAHKFGFIIRYPEGKEDITGYAYEPWHLRYVGEWIALDVYEQGITLEEYFGEAVPVTAD